ncbi:protein TEX261 [Halyomorpha halys]|uniref:protein TEX261 n=1 Tax=Halyomorpha halys TaxID=286706 RepID=UPI0006D51733|nr:protein TEX261 isoform X1 [Halyomorpha halys]
MWVLYLLSWFGIIVQMSFLLIAIASGLYYLAEIVEENTEITKKVIRWLSIFVLLVYTAILLFEDLPFILVLCGMLSQIVHLVILLDFPYITINSFSFISAILLFIINHYLAFGFFSGIFMPFYELLGYFTICIWLVPFALFISLSANDNVLPIGLFGRESWNPHPPAFLDPNETDALGNYLSQKKTKYGLLTLMHYFKEKFFPQNKKMF